MITSVVLWPSQLNLNKFTMPPLDDGAHETAENSERSAMKGKNVGPNLLDRDEKHINDYINVSFPWSNLLLIIIINVNHA